MRPPLSATKALCGTVADLESRATAALDSEPSKAHYHFGDGQGQGPLVVCPARPLSLTYHLGRGLPIQPMRVPVLVSRWFLGVACGAAPLCASLIVVLCLASGARSEQPRPAPPSPALRAAIRLYQAQQYQQAAQDLEALRQKEPQEARAPYYLALCYEKLGRPDDAIVQLQAARNLDPTGTLVSSADFQTTLDRLQKAAAQAHTQETGSALEQARQKISEGDPISGLSLLYDAQRLRPRDAAVRYQIGQAYLALGWHRQALAAFEKAKELDPKVGFAPPDEFAAKMEEAKAKAEPPPAPHDVARAKNLLGQAKTQYGSGNVEAALSLLLEARGADPLLPEVYYQLGLCYFALERMDQARAALQAAQELDPSVSFAPKAEFRDLLRRLGPAPSAPTEIPAPPIAAAQPARPLDFEGALNLMRHSAGGVFNLALKPYMPAGALEALQHLVGVLNNRGLRVYAVVLDPEGGLSAQQFADRAAERLGLGRGREIIAIDPHSIACASGDLPALEVQSLVREARLTFQREPHVAALELTRSLGERSLALRRRGILRRLLIVVPVLLLLLWALWMVRRRSLREQAHLARLRARVEWMLYRAKGRLPAAETAQARFQRAQQLFDQAGAAESREEAIALLSEALPLAEECAREAEEGAET